MIYPKELRIGNYVNWRGGDAPDEGYVEQISASDFNDLADDPAHFRPIKLTEKWLLGFGFTKRIIEIDANKTMGADYKYEISKTFTIYVRIDTGTVWLTMPSGLGSIRYQYVHELQNLFFMLAKKELEYKPIDTSKADTSETDTHVNPKPT